MKSKQVIVNLTEKLSKKQLEFIKNSCSDSFPNQKIIFNKNIITIENNKKKINQNPRKKIFRKKKYKKNFIKKKN